MTIMTSTTTSSIIIIRVSFILEVYRALNMCLIKFIAYTISLNIYKQPKLNIIMAPHFAEDKTET